MSLSSCLICENYPLQAYRYPIHHFDCQTEHMTTWFLGSKLPGMDIAYRAEADQDGDTAAWMVHSHP